MSTESPSEPHPTPEEAQPSTAFMTGIGAERGNEVSEFPVLASTFPEVVRTYGQLMATLTHLPSSVDRLLNSHSDSCYLAYKTHMYGVQAEYASLLGLAQAQEVKTKQDATIQSLETELEWFMAEALRLDLLLTQSLVKEEAKVRTEIAIASDDVKFLEKQVRRKDTVPEISDAPVVHAINTLASVQVPALLEAKNPLESPEVTAKKKELAKLRKDLLNAQSTKGKRTRKLSELEGIFLSSVEESRKHIAHCKHLNKTSNIGNHAAEKLIENPQVLALLYERIFPWKSTINNMSR